MTMSEMLAHGMHRCWHAVAVPTRPLELVGYGGDTAYDARDAGFKGLVMAGSCHVPCATSSRTH
jgi:hypothetical protein